eukprot:COSAG06_NODE_22073_length_734_cov_56.214173_1_plen_75_part_10
MPVLGMLLLLALRPQASARAWRRRRATLRAQQQARNEAKFFSRREQTPVLAWRPAKPPQVAPGNRREQHGWALDE